MTSSHSFSYDGDAAFDRAKRIAEAAFHGGGEEGQPGFKRTATRADLLEAVAASCPSLSRAQARDVFEMALGEISDALTQGETVKLRSFGHFSVREKRERIGRNPRTGVEVPIKPRRVLTFKPSPVLLDQVNGRESRHEDEGP